MPADNKGATDTEADQVSLTPCINNCCLDENDVCCGCKRTLDEILHWSGYSQKERIKLMAEIRERP